ncbi:hypothetical protein DYD21_00885 [Rhodohalobacter sp. SW132]|nr:hypothetical protein DYD21_00885 [Rhodohalobacter sp. SW132]
MVTLFITCNAFAQTGQRPGEVFIQQANFDHTEAAQQFTSDFTALFDMSLDAVDLFDGRTNTAFVNLYGSDNQSSVTQSGWGNVAMVNILGDRNRSGLQQRGNSNRFILNLEGSDGLVDGMQAGKNNFLRMDLIGNTHNQTFSQTGANLSLQLIDNGGGGVPMQIEQRGNGASVIIENY